jgi:hypothetical protein
MTWTNIFKIIGIIASISATIGFLYWIYEKIKAKRIEIFINKNYHRYNYDYDSMFPEIKRKFNCSESKYIDILQGLEFKDKLPKKK